MSVISGAINVYSIPEPTEEELAQRMDDKALGIVRYHKTTWLEWELPLEVEKKAERYIEKQLKKFLGKCQCENCKEKRADIK